MEQPMVKNLLKAGLTVKVYDVLLAAQEALVNDGAIITTSLQEAVQEVDVIITMLQTSQQVKDVADIIFKFAKKNSLYIDCSSIEIAVAKELHITAEKNAIAMLDAPVSGGVLGAQ